MKAIQLLVIFLVLSVLPAGFLPAYAQTEPQVNAHSAIVIDSSSGDVIYAKKADSIMYPASTTKIMTALLAVENGNLEQLVTLGEEVNMIAWDSSRAYLQPGDRISLRDLIYGMMLASGNDAAYAVAVHIAREAGSVDLSSAEALKQFVAMMNERAKEIGALQTNFENPDGYPHSNHYTTAEDMAKIMAEAMKNPDFRVFDSTAYHSPQTWAGSLTRAWKNGNYLIQPDSGFFYAKALGGKTGYTVPAGFTMVATAGEDDRKLVAVALNTDADGRWLDTTAMLEYGFSTYNPEAENEVIQGEKVIPANKEYDTEEPMHWLHRLLRWLNLI